MNTSKIKVLGLLGLPLLAIAIAVMLFAFNPTTPTTEAVVDGAAMGIDCPDNVSRGEVFKCSITADAIPPGGGQVGDPLPDGGYVLAQTYIVFSNNVTFVDSTITWPDCSVEVEAQGDLKTNPTPQDLGFASVGCLTGLTPAVQFGSQFKGGELFTFTLLAPNEKKKITVQMIGVGNPPGGTSGASYKTFGTNTEIPVPDSDVIVIQVKNPPTATPTATPPPIPKMSKCDQTDNNEDGFKDSDTLNEAGDAVVDTNCVSQINHWLVRQGSKIPPADCLSVSTDPDFPGFVSLGEKLSQAIVSPDSKAGEPTSHDKFQQLAAFEFEVHYDATKVCIDLTVGDQFAGGNPIDDPESPGIGICVVEDDEPDSKPQLEGVARIGCVTVGKDNGIDELVALAIIDVYPQPEVYSQAKPNQFNGVVVQINNVNCDLSDEQGEAIPIFSCDDADITFRYLEGDVDPDCSVDASDAQAIAFRWGTSKGSLIYKDFMNLEPSNQQGDNDIDINDLQFVFGRFGSTCKDPHPDQDPVNPKA